MADIFDYNLYALLPIHEDLWKHTGFFQGDDVTFSVDLPILSDVSGSYTLYYVWARQGVTAFIWQSTPVVGDLQGFSFYIPAATTAAYVPGNYYITAYLISNTDGTKHTIGQREGFVKPNPMFVADPRSPNRKALDKVEQALAEGAGSDVIEYVVGGKTIKKSRPQMLQLRAYYLNRVKAEEGRAIGRISYYL